MRCPIPSLSCSPPFWQAYSPLAGDVEVHVLSDFVLHGCVGVVVEVVACGRVCGLESVSKRHDDDGGGEGERKRSDGWTGGNQAPPRLYPSCTNTTRASSPPDTACWSWKWGRGHGVSRERRGKRKERLRALLAIGPAAITSRNAWPMLLFR